MPVTGRVWQPNSVVDAEARLTLRLWLAVIVTGVLAGLAGAGLMLLLYSVQHLAFGVGYDGQGFSAAVARASGWERATPLLIGGVIAGVGWYLLRRYTPGQKSEVDEILWTGQGRLSFRRSVGTATLSEVVIGLGASIGRENGPKLLGAVAGNLLGGWTGLTVPQRRLLVACGAGAGLAAVYNVPLGGALFTAEVLLGAIRLPVVLPALACAGLATLTARVYLSDAPTYLDIRAYPFDTRLLVWALLLGPVVGVFSAGYVWLLGWLAHHRVTGAWLLVTPLLAFGVLALVALKCPQLYGNGRGMAEQAFLGLGSIGLLLALAVLKPFVTMLCLGSGASGGLFTPTLSTGAVLGGGLGLVWTTFWPGSPIGAYAMIGASALIGAAMQAPLAALVFLLELTHSGFDLVLPMLLATVLATFTARKIDTHSMYSARLTAPVSTRV